MRKAGWRIVATVALVLMSGRAGPAEAAEIKIMCAEAMKAAMDELLPDFERQGGHKVTIAYATAGVLAGRVRGGEAADLTIIPKSAFDPLVGEGKIVAGSVTKVAQSLLALAVPAGAPKPDIATIDAFKRALLGAKSIVYSDPTKGGAIGLEAARVIERLGLTDQLKSKTTLTPGGEFRDLLVKREAELAFVQPISVAGYAGIDLVGPIPAELQPVASYAFLAGVTANAREPAVAQTFIQFLLSPAAARIIKAKGMEPG